MALSAASLCAQWRAAYCSADGYLEEAEDDQQDTFEIVLFAVRESGDNFEFASERLRDNETIAYAAIAACPYSLQFASVRLRESYSVAIRAVLQDPMSFKYAGYELKANERFAMYGVAGDWRNVTEMSISLGGRNGRLRRYVDFHRRAHSQFVKAGWRVLINMRYAGVPAEVLVELKALVWEQQLWPIAAAAHDALKACNL